MIGIIMIGTILILCIVFGVYMLFRSEIVYKNHMIISNAIHMYHRDMIARGRFFNFEVDYDDAESYDKTVFRLFDFGYENILPKEKYEIIKSYIDKRQRRK